MTPQQLRKKISRLEEHQPLTTTFEATVAARKTRRKDPWYGSQKEHWLGWLKGYDGPGHYDRATWEVSAGAVYNRVVNSAMLLWLCEASGVPRATVTMAATAALEADDTMMAQSGAIRRIYLHAWPIGHSRKRCNDYASNSE